MAGDLQSTSHGAVAGSDSQKESASFDLRSWQGLTAILKAGRDANLPPLEYAAFRDTGCASGAHGRRPQQLDLRGRRQRIIAMEI